MKRIILVFIGITLVISCKKKIPKVEITYKQETKQEVYNQPYILILGTAQDAGYPQVICQKECCKACL